MYIILYSIIYWITYVVEANYTPCLLSVFVILVNLKFSDADYCRVNNNRQLSSPFAILITRSPLWTTRIICISEWNFIEGTGYLHTYYVFLFLL